MSSNAEKPQSKGVIGAMASSGAANTERRRSSASSAQKFASLHNQKRNSQDPAVHARKASLADQKAPAGLLGGLWNSFTRGTPGK